MLRTEIDGGFALIQAGNMLLRQEVVLSQDPKNVALAAAQLDEAGRGSYSVSQFRQQETVPGGKPSLRFFVKVVVPIRISFSSRGSWTPLFGGTGCHQDHDRRGLLVFKNKATFK